MRTNLEKDYEGRKQRSCRGWMWLTLSIFACSLVLGSFLLLPGAIEIRQYITPSNSPLPRVPLKGGGEFRVVKVGYGTRHQHGRDPEVSFWLWNHLPAWLQARIPYPEEGAGIGTSVPSVAIWWAWFDPKTRAPMLGPTGSGEVVFDSGATRSLRPESVSAGDIRPLLILEPPQDSKHLKVRIPVNDEPVEFQLANPAYQ